MFSTFSAAMLIAALLISSGAFGVDATTPETHSTENAITPRHNSSLRTSGRKLQAGSFGSISGQVLQDADGDGVGDDPLSYLLVTLVDESRNRSGATLTDSSGVYVFYEGMIVASTYTDFNGDYAFNDLPASDYAVIQRDLIDFASVSDADGSINGLNVIGVTIGGSESTYSSTGNDFVDVPLASLDAAGIFFSISGNVTVDSGSDTSGDRSMFSPLSDVLIIVNGSNYRATTYTDSSGKYNFSPDTAGDYTITCALSSIRTIAVTIGGSESRLSVGNNFVNYLDVGAISGRVQQDQNGDGVPDAPLQGILLTLVNENGGTNSTTLTDSSGTYVYFDSMIVATTSTNSYGDYVFDHLPVENEYSVVKSDMIGFASVLGNNVISGVSIGGQNPVVSMDNNFIDVRLRSFEDTSYFSIFGRVNLDTANDPNDPVGNRLLDGVLVVLASGVGGGDIASTYTDSNGDYIFSPGVAGDYILQVASFVNFLQPIAVTIGGSESRVSSGNNFVANFASGTISGKVSEDTFRWRNRYIPLANVVITLLDEFDERSGPSAALTDSSGRYEFFESQIITTTSTDANGEYTFYGVPVYQRFFPQARANYAVVQSDMPGFASVSDRDGNLNGNNVIGVTFVNGFPAGTYESTLNWFTDVQVAPTVPDRNFFSISGFVPFDQNEGDDGGNLVPIPNSRLVLLSRVGDPNFARTSTDYGGNYMFSPEIAGQYRVVSTLGEIVVTIGGAESQVSTGNDFFSAPPTSQPSMPPLDPPPTSQPSMPPLDPEASCNNSILSDGKDYRIVPRHNENSALSVHQDGSIVITTKASTGTRQIWNARRVVGSVYYHLVNVGNDGGAINVSGESDSNKADIISWPLSTPNSSNDDWCLQDVGDGSGYMYLIAAHVLVTGKDRVIDVSGQGTADGTNVLQYDKHIDNFFGSFHQQFFFEEVHSSCDVCVSPGAHEAATTTLQALVDTLTLQIETTTTSLTDTIEDLKTSLSIKDEELLAYKALVDGRLSALEGSK